MPRARALSWVLVGALRAFACVPSVEVNETPCPCGDAYYCCPHTLRCVEHDDASCWSDGPLTRPRLVGRLRDAHDARDVAVLASTLAVADGDNGLLLAELDVDGAPHTLSRAVTSAPALGVALTADTALVTVGASGLQSFDLGDVAAPAVLWLTDTGDRAVRVTLAGSVAYVADDRAGVRIFDVSDRSGPRRLSIIASRGVTVRREGVFISGARNTSIDNARLAIADGDGGLHLVGVSEPAAPQHLARFPENRYDVIVDSRDVVTTGSLVWVADHSKGLVIVDASNPVLPQQVGGYDEPCDAVALFDGLAAIATTGGWVLLVDVADVATPVLVSAYDAGDAIMSLRVFDGRLYVAASSAGVHVLAATGATSSGADALAPETAVRTGREIP
ncbi:MAG: hypothetical protein AAB426_14450 [Myxococcota bacterium]